MLDYILEAGWYLQIWQWHFYAPTVHLYDVQWEHKSVFPITTVCLCAHTPIQTERCGQVDSSPITDWSLHLSGISALQVWSGVRRFLLHLHKHMEKAQEVTGELTMFPPEVMSALFVCPGFLRHQSRVWSNTYFIKCWFNMYLAQWINRCSLETLANLIFYKLLDTNTEGRGSKLLNSSDWIINTLKV